jgi:hypothetical protein
MKKTVYDDMIIFNCYNKDCECFVGNKEQSLDKFNQREAVDMLKKLDLWNDCQFRSDGRIEWVCKHGVGHTVWASKKLGKSGYTYGCDGCCSKKYSEVEVFF